MFTGLHLCETGKTSHGRPVYRLDADLRYDIRFNGGHQLLIVPEGFETDFASVPRFLWPVFPPNGPWAKAAVVHDFLYRVRCSRWIADAIFRDAMRELGVVCWKRWLMWAAVRVFGRKAKQCPK